MKKYTLIPILLIIIFTATSSIAQDPLIQLGKGGITDIAYVADGTKLVVATTMGVKIYDAINWIITGLSLTNDGNTLISNSVNGAISIRDISKL